MTDNDNRRDLFEQVATLLKLNGIVIDEQVIHHMQPLLDGSMSYEEHQEMLKSIIAKAQNNA